MIILDTHIWVWWVDVDVRLPTKLRDYLDCGEDNFGVSVISCWEIAKLVEIRCLALSYPVGEWLDLALAYPGIELLTLTPQIVVEATQLPGIFHRDPADQIIVAAARVFACPLLTFDSKILACPHVQAFSLPPNTA